VLDSNRPAVNTDTHDQPGRGPRRNDAARAATPIASTASPSTEPAGMTAANMGSNAHAQAVKCAAARTATDRNRRNQPRTVETGRPTATATRRCPTPPAATSNAGPITATVSTRRANTTSGNNTWVTPQSRHRPRRGRSTTPPSTPRRTRRRANAHRTRTPPQPGHPTTPAARSASTRTGSLHTMSTMPPASPGGPPRARPRGKRGGPCANRDIPTLSPPQRHHKHQLSPTASSPSMSPQAAPVLNQRVAQQRWSPAHSGADSVGPRWRL
jgi:hypothetical protein